jgi:hypothetical protein
MKISRATYYRWKKWKKRLKAFGLAGLKRKSRKLKRLQAKVHWTAELVVAIETLRKENPTWGDGPFDLLWEGWPPGERADGGTHPGVFGGQGEGGSRGVFWRRLTGSKSGAKATRPYVLGRR